MDGRGGCCIARYAGGAYDRSKVDSIMLRFRPIAPKPATGVSASGGSTPENNNEVNVRSGRGKRRYVRDNNSNNNNNNKRCNRKRKAVPEKKEGFAGETVVTLPLLPEAPDRKDSPARGSPTDHPDLTTTTTTTTKQVQNLPIWLNFNNTVNKNHQAYGFCGSDRTVVMPQPLRLVGSCVTVECVTETWVDVGDGLGCTDEERRKNLEWDTCPGFISDGLNRVAWTNGAYRRMVGQGDGEEMMVWLVIKERVPVTYPAFTCRVRLQYTCGKDRSSLTLPCDVWRMDGGGSAWRLDVKAALSLGR